MVVGTYSGVTRSVPPRGEILKARLTVKVGQLNTVNSILLVTTSIRRQRGIPLQARLG